jgi:carboxypeptidase family protein
MAFKQHILIIAWALALIGSTSVSVWAQTVADDKQSEGDRSGKITGRVVNQNGQPITNASVNVRSYGSVGPSLSLTTDTEGKFEATGLVPRAYLVSAMAAGYVSVPRDPDLNPVGYYRVGDSVTVQMMKGAVITGRVKNSSNEPVVAVVVRASMIRDQKGQRARYSVPMRMSTTDDRGVYRIYGLAPGTYVVSAGGGRMMPYGIDPYGDNAPIFAPSSTRDSASEVAVNAGDEISNIDIRYREEVAYTVSGTMTAPAADQRNSINVILIPVFNGVPQAGYSSFQPPGMPAFVFTGIPDGDYDIVVQSYLGTGELALSDPRRIAVRGRDIEGIELAAKTLGSISGNLVLEDSKAPECEGKRRPLFSETVIGPWHNEKNEPKGQPPFIWSLGAPTLPDNQGNFVLKNLAAGEYRFNARPLAKYWYLKSISWPASARATQTNQPLDAARNWTTLRSGERLSGLTITFSAGAASLGGRVDAGEGQKLPPRLFVYLAPAEREKSEDVLRYFAAPSLEDGTFSASNVPPGSYWVIAKAAGENDSNMMSKLRLPDETELRVKILRDGEAAKVRTELKPCQNLKDYLIHFSP